jgi:NAD-reducing hydrogenase large subunit
MYFHYARLIEILYGIERVAVSCSTTPEILSERSDRREHFELNAGGRGGDRGAARDACIHHYFVDEHGSIEKSQPDHRLGQNNNAMNRAVTQVAKANVKGNQLEESMLNMVEAAVRCYDPCLSCSTHAIGQMPLRIELYDDNHQLLDQVGR